MWVKYMEKKIIENVFVLKQNTVVCFYVVVFFKHNTEPGTKHKLT